MKKPVKPSRVKALLYGAAAVLVFVAGAGVGYYHATGRTVQVSVYGHTVCQFPGMRQT